MKPQGVWQLRAMAAERQHSELKPRYDTAVQALTEKREQNKKIQSILSPQREEEDEVC